MADKNFAEIFFLARGNFGKKKENFLTSFSPRPLYDKCFYSKGLNERGLETLKERFSPIVIRSAKILYQNFMSN